ncbi:UNVERIFIED_CONTAM: hypothetical protein Sradi_4159800 [Sesamum radiatum]|uniref:Zinc finger PMZ-type domain-containing protein n=1 Tax=Sesamum radiatum TaxID=300843 RepID=A0AAW2P5T2_SESRA
MVDNRFELINEDKELVSLCLASQYSREVNLHMDGELHFINVMGSQVGSSNVVNERLENNRGPNIGIDDIEANLVDVRVGGVEVDLVEGSEDSNSDYNVYANDEQIHGDDDGLFMENIDPCVEWRDDGANVTITESDDSGSDCGEVDLAESEDDLQSLGVILVVMKETVLFEQEFRTDPRRNIKGFKSDVVRDIRCHVSQSQAYKAKWKALKKIEENPDDQYKQLWDYAGEIQKTNPGSTVFMSTTEGGTQNERKFNRLLKEDLQIVRDYEYTLISDKQKGLIPAVETVMSTIEQRAKPILTLVEWIREYLMIRKWDLTGIPCKHALCAILCDNGNPEEYVHDCYTVDTFLKVYEHSIKLMNGLELWEKTGYIPPLPPKFRKGVGRPKKLRRREVDEPAQKQKKKSRGMKERLKRQQGTVKCKGCGLGKHNIKTCKRVLRDETNPPVNRVPDEQPLAKDRVETAEDIYSELLQSECLDDVMIDAPDSIMKYGENEPSTNAPKKLQVKKKRKTTSATHTLETVKKTLHKDVKNKISNKNGFKT